MHQNRQNTSNYLEMKQCVESISTPSTIRKKYSEVNYSFYVGGHSYGSPNTVSEGLYSKFYGDIQSRQHALDFGVLTGDIVQTSSAHSWGKVNSQLDKLTIKTYMAPGNHDVGIGPYNSKRDIYKIINGETYYSFKRNNDLFIVLDPGISNWDIIGDQLIFLKENINSGTYDNIFIFMHQVIWKDNAPDISFNKIIYNSDEGKEPGGTNYWSDIAPILEQIESNIYIISGDVGAIDNGSELFCGTINKIKYLASGMGSDVHDNYLIFSINKAPITSVDVKVVDLK